MDPALRALLLLIALSLPLQLRGADTILTQDVFERVKPAVVQVRIIDRQSGTKSAIGSGFFVSADGYAVTNYHVVNELISQQGSYRAEIVDYRENTTAVTVVHVDVVHDIAVIKADKVPDHFLQFSATDPQQGTRIFSLGNPHDLGMTIVEGTYNGHIKNSLYEKIHFSGSINPGMSGGPGVNTLGQVIGVNVSTAGNQMSFLVPARFARQRLRQATAGTVTAVDLADVVREQLIDNQDRYIAKFFQTTLQSTALGAFQVPGRFSPLLKCWGNTPDHQQELYKVSTKQCSTDDYIYLNARHYTGHISFIHKLITDKSLGPTRFNSAFQDYFHRDFDGLASTERDVTNFQCKDRYVANGTLPLRVMFCVRGYKKYRGLYDSALRIASLGARQTGLLSSMVLTGVSFDNAVRVSRQYLEAIRWKK